MDNSSSSLKEQEDFSYAMELVTLSSLPMALKAAIELNVFNIIAAQGKDMKMSSSDIVKHMNTQNPEASLMLDRILMLLSTFSVLNCTLLHVDDEHEHSYASSSIRLYELTPLAKYFVVNEDGVSLGPLIALTQDRVFLDCWAQLKDAVLEGGIPFNRVHGTHAFHYPKKDLRFNRVFNTAMLNHTTIVVNKILELYNRFDNIHKLVDVGGGLGVTLSLITSKYSSIIGINFDLPHVLKDAPSYPRVEHVGGDMFESVPKGDAIFLKWILHDWSDENCLKLLRNCYTSIPDDGKIIVVDAILPVAPDSSCTVKAISLTDVLMMNVNPGGKERTQQEFTNLAIKSGFSGVRFECCVYNFWVMEIFK